MLETITKPMALVGVFLFEVVIIPYHLLESAYYRAENIVYSKKR
jgi:hypothetical protein